MWQGWTFSEGVLWCEPTHLDDWVSVIPVSFETKMTQATLFGLQWVPCIEGILGQTATLLCSYIWGTSDCSCLKCCVSSGQRLSVSYKKSTISQGELFNFNWLGCVFLINSTQNKQTKPLGFDLGSLLVCSFSLEQLLGWAWFCFRKDWDPRRIWTRFVLGFGRGLHLCTS